MESLVTALTQFSGPHLTVLAGPVGIGRSHALRQVREAMTRADRPVLDVRLAPEDRHEPGYLSGRLLAGLTALTSVRSWPSEPPGFPLIRALHRRPGLVVLVDDLQWADPASAETIRGVLHDVSRVPVRFVATVRTGAAPRADLAAAYADLRRAGLARIERLRPLSPAAADALVSRLLQATPHRTLRCRLRRLSRGRPGALIAAVEGYRASGSLRVAQRRAYLTDPEAEPRIPGDHDLLGAVHRLDDGARRVARALAALQPLGPAVPALIGRALALPPDEVDTHLGMLREEGLAHGGRITVPAVAVALRDTLGPYERRRFAQVAAEALWSGEAECADPGFLPDALAVAGTLVDPARAVADLRAHARAAAVRAPASAGRWWSGAAALGGDPADRAEALLARAAADLRAGRHADARPPLQRLLTDHAETLTAPAREEAELLSLTAARGARDLTAIRAAAAGDPWFPAGPAPAPATRAAALSLLNRWAEARRALTAAPSPSGVPGTAGEPAGPVVGEGARMIAAEIEAVTGRSIALPPATVDDDGPGAARRHAAAAADRLTLSLVTGGPIPPPGGDGPAHPRDDAVARHTGGVAAPVRRDAAGRLNGAGGVAARGNDGAATPPAGHPGGAGGVAAPMRSDAAGRVSVDAARPPAGHPSGADGDPAAPERCLVDWQRGRWVEALDAATVAIAADLAVGRRTGHAAVHRAAAEILLAGGWPARARSMLDGARDGVPLPHLLAPIEAELEWVLGDAAGAARVVDAALDDAAAHGLVIGTDELWAAAAEHAAERGDREAAARAAGCATAAAGTLGTGTAALHAATARLIAGTAASPVDEAAVVDAARALDRPYLLARTLERVVRWTGRRPELLAEAYELLGDLGATLHRSRVRQAMREHGLAVPGRVETLAEGDQLLAALVAEGLSNRQLAAATQSSEKSVEGRLSRLFTRTGYRSRVELAAAVLVGDYRIG
ncbi:hypothetical protein [Catenuloplanes atrovinosus]|uniref:HTH luxR-type domain-containing protein n=1 Tax=Catenuloplanes atrovinosus TaxID=137266 RepID=A0AAE3YJV6_9ACTN|nr:hypothetical protein [Catenuloplanes atrovinosus]MDR7274252.1 hypothetical protein [Catenuloplanes atrovinosus]